MPEPDVTERIEFLCSLLADLEPDGLPARAVRQLLAEATEERDTAASADEDAHPGAP